MNPEEEEAEELPFGLAALDPPPGHACWADKRCVCGHTLLAHFLIGDAGQRGCGRDRAHCSCRQFVEAKEDV